MRIAITGAMGFIGTEITKLALKEKAEVVAVDFYDKLIPHYEMNRYPILDDVYDNLSRCATVVSPWDFVEDLPKHKPQVIIHAGAVVNTKAATTGMSQGAEELFERNVRYVRRLVEQTSRFGSNIVFMSSASVYGAAPRLHPINPYALTKSMGEKIVEAGAHRRTILRLFNVFGRNEHHKGEMASVPFKIAQAYRSGDKFEMFCPDAERDFVPVSTVARVALNAASATLAPPLPIGQPLMTFDVGTGEPTSFRRLDEMIMHATGNRSSVTREIMIPRELHERYQGFTKAGNIPGTLVAGFGSTRMGIEEMYGKR